MNNILSLGYIATYILKPIFLRITLLVAAFIAFFLCFISPAFALSNQITPSSGPVIVTASVASGTISVCVGSASSNPNIEDFNVLGNNLTAAIIATAPAGFEVSLTSGGGYGNSVMLNQSSGKVANTTIFVRSAAGDAAGRISGDVVLSSTGATSQNVLVLATVNALPTVDHINDQTILSGAATGAVNFTGTGSTFYWSNNNTSIGLAGSGSGNIASFTGVNNGSSPVTATIKVVPSSAGMLYITKYINNTLEVINTVTGAIVTIPTPNNPNCVSASPDGTRVYVSNLNVDAPESNVSVINTLNNTIIANIEVGERPYEQVVTPDGKWLYVSVENLNAPTNTSINTIAVINTATNTVSTNISVPASSGALALSPDGSLLYTGSADTLSVISTATNSILYELPLKIENPYGGIATSPDGSKVYVTNVSANTVSVINTPVTSTSKVTAIIPVGVAPYIILASPDGSRVYTSNEDAKAENSISVIDAATNTVIATIPEPIPVGMSISPDSKNLYVDLSNNNAIDVIDTKTNQSINTLSDGPPGYSVTEGNFYIPPSDCPGVTSTFTITVLPASAVPSFTVGPVTGSISACSGMASVSPNIQQFSVSGVNLTDAVTATAPAGFEVSLTADGGYGSTVELEQSEGVLNNVIVYVRAAADNTIAGPISGNVVLSFTGLPSQDAAVSGTINDTPTVNAIPDQIVTNDATTTEVIFNGTNNTTFNWTNDTPDIGLPPSGTGNISPFTAINTSATPITARIIVTPVNTTGCSGAPVIFRIIVNPTVTLTASGSLSPFTTAYGTSSTAQSFTVSGTNISSGILVTAPTGFEVSSDGISYSATITINGTGNISSAPVYVRLASGSPAGSYDGGNITVSTNYAPDVKLPVPNSTVTPEPLTITADNKTKLFGAVNPVFTVTYTGFVNSDGPAQLTKQPDVTTVATTLSPFGQYPIIVSGAVSVNYSFTYVPGILIIKPILNSTSIPNTFTPNGDGVNDTWQIAGLEYYQKATVNIFNRWGQKVYSSTGYATPWDGTYNGKALPAGTYYYIIDLKNGQAVISSWVAIVR